MNELGSIAPVLTKDGVAKAFEVLLAKPEDRHSELLDLNHAPNVKNLPPAFVVTAEYDVLRDEAEYYAARLHKNGVPVSCAPKTFQTMIHGMHDLPPVLISILTNCTRPLRTAKRHA